MRTHLKSPVLVASRLISRIVCLARGFIAKRTRYTPPTTLGGLIEVLIERRGIDAGSRLQEDDIKKSGSALAITDGTTSGSAPLPARDGLLSSWLSLLRPGDFVDARDSSGQWYESIILADDTIPAGAIRVHFRGWSKKWDDTISAEDKQDRIQPLFSKTGDWRGMLRVSHLT
jgi:hypothetical protein